MGEGVTAKVLKDRHRLIREMHPEDLRVRVHRALSWLERAEQEVDDDDARFIFLWIALNAAYAREFGFEQSEREQTRQFFQRLLACDTKGRLQGVVFQQFTGPIRTLIENKFVFEPFWKALREHDGSGAWEQKFATARSLAMKALLERQTDLVLSIVTDRLHVLRNQLVHGGATWNSGTNRAQVRDASAILAVLMPEVLALMMEHPELELETVAYPVVPI